MTIPEEDTDGPAMGEDYAGKTVAAVAQAQTISADEIALYDRQIRLWGVKAQEKLRTAHVLIIKFKALANEVAKNLVLAGIGSVTIADNEAVVEDDICSQFLISEDDVGKNRAKAALPRLQKLNPRVTLHADPQDIRTRGADYFTPFDIIIATCLDLDTLVSINTYARRANRSFYASETHGFYGYIFADLIKHEYVIERERSNVVTTLKAETRTRSIIGTSTKKENGKMIEMVTKEELYTPLSLANTAPLPPEYQGKRRRLRQITPLLTGIKALWEFQRLQGHLPSHSHADLELFTRLATEQHRTLQLPAETLTSEFLRSFLQNIGGELVPVTAFLGGELAQDVINVLGQREQPIQNFLLFDGQETKGPIYALHPINSDETSQDTL